VDTIIIERADRLSRDLIVSELFLRDCKEKNVKIYTSDSGEEIVNSNGDPTRTLIRQILAAVAQWDKSVICKKLQAGRRAKAERTGKPCGGPQPTPYGDRGGLAQKNVEREVLRTILNLRREGFHAPTLGHLRKARINS
jgi:DNA invertase Pin-like site-specific DNA recombinase